MQSIIKEQIRKKVTRSGNGGAVWVPRAWLGEEIIVTRIETPKLSIEEELLSILLPNLDKVVGVFLYGSYSRNEETKDSDIDILIIAKEKFKMENARRFDINLIEVDKIRKAVQKNPFIYSMIKESRAVINSYLLDELKKEKKDFKSFIRWYKEETIDSLRTTKELIDLDKLESDFIHSYSIIYSMVLRLRGIFLINSVLDNKEFSNSTFKKYITRFISDNEYRKMYKIYINIRDNKREHIDIEIDRANKLLEILEKEVNNLDA